MSEKVKEADGDNDGCVFLLGALIVGICVGNLYGAVYGWLVIGSLLAFVGFLSCIRR